MKTTHKSVKNPLKKSLKSCSTDTLVAKDRNKDPKTRSNHQNSNLKSAKSENMFLSMLNTKAKVIQRWYRSLKSSSISSSELNVKYESRIFHGISPQDEQDEVFERRRQKAEMARLVRINFLIVGNS